MTYNTPITDADLHAYVDDQLAPSRRKEVEVYLQEHPEALLVIEEYRRINTGLHALFDPVLEEPVPPQLAVARPRRWQMLRVAAIAAWVSIGGVIGWVLHPAATTQTIAVSAVHEDLIRPAAFAHAIYSVEVKHPVEVSADQEAHLVAWLSKRLHTEVRAPDLSSQGLILVGGRLLPSTNRMAAQFMYERNDGIRITLYTRQGVWDNEATSFRFERIANTGVFYWIDGPLGYALVGDLERKELLAVSELVYQHLHQ